MDLKNKIIKIFKEDIDSIKSLKVAAAAGDNTALRVRDTPPEDIRTKSYFLENYVHQIVFKNIVQGQKRYYYTIYRKITKEEYDKLKKNYQVTYAIKPTDVEEHSEDVYYTPEKTYNKTSKSTTKTFTARNFLYLKKSEADSYNSKLPSEYKLEPVPIKDIYEKGIGARSITIRDYLEYVESQKKQKSVRKKDFVPVTQNKEKVIDFFSDENVKKLIKKIIVSYQKRFSADSSKEDRVDATAKYKEARNTLTDKINNLVSKASGNKDEIEELIFDNLKEKFVSEKLFNYFKKYYEEGEADVAPEKPVDDTPSSKDKEKSTYKYTPKDDKKIDVSKVSVDTKGNFLSKKDKESNLRSTIQAYSDFAYAQSTEDKNLFQSKFYDKAIELISSVVNDTKDLESSDKAMSEIEDYIKSFFKQQQIPENPDLYKRMKTIYDRMKQAKSSQRISEAEDKKTYVVSTIVGSQVDKLYDSNKNKRKLGPGTYILNLDSRQVSNLERLAKSPKLSGVQSIVSQDEYIKTKKADAPKKDDEKVKKDEPEKSLKGYRSASGAEKVRAQDYFDPTNPNHLAALKGKAKPGEMVYSVSFKVGDKRSEDVMMPFSQIKKFVPDFEVSSNVKQQPTFDFEMKKPRTISKDTGNVIYDIVKGSLKLNSSNPINRPTQEPKAMMPAQYFVINKDNKRVVKGFATEKEADDFAKGMGSSEYISVNKINLPKYGVNLMSKNRPSENKIKEEKTEFDEKDIVKQQVIFTIKGLDLEEPDTQANVKGGVERVTLNKDKKELTVFLDDKSQAIFTGTTGGNATGVYDPDPTDKFGSPRKIIDVKEPLSGYLDKIFPKPSAKAKLESYIRQRIRRALQETELGQYFGVQGPDVKKKRLEEYMKKYEWGFQESEDPYVRGTGAEKHAIVNKLVHELGDEGVAIFNSYAPKGQEIARPDDLNDMADTPLGSQLYQPYDPNSLTARGGRIAEEDAKYDSLYNQAKRDVENKYKDVESLAAGYNRKDREIERSPTLKKIIQKAIQKAYGEDAAKATPELKKAFMAISDEDLKSSR